MPHTILVVDASLSGPESLRHGVDGSPDLEIWEHVSSWADARGALTAGVPDLILADAALTHSGTNGEIDRIQAAHPDLPVLVVSPPAEDHHTRRALQAGAHGVISRTTSPDALLAAIRSVLMGHLVLPPSARERLIAVPKRSPAIRSPRQNGATEGLSHRQLEVLRLIGHGLATTEIADRLGISPKTVETHRVHIKRRLGLSTSNALIRWAALWVESERT